MIWFSGLKSISISIIIWAITAKLTQNSTIKIPKIWRRALVVVIPKPGKSMGNPKSYQLISLLCVPYKILEKLIYTCVGPLIDPLLPKEQAGFRCGKSTIDQVVLLTQNIEDSFKAKKKAGAVFVNLTAAYDTVWHCGLTCKLLRLLPDKHMVKMIMELVRNRSFTLTTSRRRLKRYPLPVRHKQDWGRGFILLLPQTAALPGSDAGSDVIKPASSFVIQNCQTSCSMWCPMYRACC